MNAVFQSFSIGSSVWLSLWSNDNLTVVNGTVDTVKRDMYLGVYGALGLGQGTFPTLHAKPCNILFVGRQIRLDSHLKSRVDRG